LNHELIEVRSAGRGGGCYPHLSETVGGPEINGQRNRPIGRKASGRREGYCPCAGSIDRYVAWTIDRAPVGVAEYERLGSGLIHLKFSEAVGDIVGEIRVAGPAEPSINCFSYVPAALCGVFGFGGGARQVD